VQYDIHTHSSTPSSEAIYNQIFRTESIKRSGYFSSGIHPWHIPDDIQWDLFEKLVNNPSCVAIGECGLDKICATPFELQINVLKEQIRIAEKLQLPLILHCVRSFQELIRLKNETKSTIPWVIHGFEKGKVLDQLIHAGFYISFGSALCKSENSVLRNAASSIPLDRVFLETDDQDRYSISDVYKAFSLTRSESASEVELNIEKNIKRIFAKWKIG